MYTMDTQDLFYHYASNIKDRPHAKEFFEGLFDHMGSKNMACLVGDMSRRYARRLNEIGSSGLPWIINLLKEEDKIYLIKIRRKTWVMSKKSIEERTKQDLLEIPDADEYTIRERNKEFFINNAKERGGL